MSSYSFPSNGFHHMLSSINFDGFSTLTPEGAELFEPDFPSFESGPMNTQNSVNGILGVEDPRSGTSPPTHRFPFLDPHQAFSGASSGRPGPYRSPPTSDSERLRQFYHDEQQLSDVTGIRYPYLPTGGSHSAQNNDYYMANEQGYGTQWPVTAAGNSQPPLITDTGMSGFAFANNDDVSVPDFWSHSDRFHQGLNDGGSQNNPRRPAFYPSQETLDPTIPDHATATNRSLHNLQASGSGNTEQHPKRKSRKARAKNASSTDEDGESPEAVGDESEIPEPDATYAFNVKDWNDVYLDPKPSKSFGTHEPHLARKVANVAKRLRNEKKGAPGRALATMTELHTSIQARAMSLMSQPGPRPQTSKIPRHKQWDAPSNDHSIPTTAVAYGVCLRLLVNAIFNRENCMESENTEFRNRYYATSTYYSEEAVYGLATRILDELIDVHENGFWHETLDPDYDERYRKTQDFNFRDRFNLVTRLLKHSKSTCNELFKNFRLHDVIGGAYDLETRVWSNYKNNKAKAEKEKKRRTEEALKKVEVETPESAATQKPPRKTLPLKRVTAATGSTGPRDGFSVAAPVASNESTSTETSSLSRARTKKAQPAKRRIEDTDDDPEPQSAPAKKLKTGPRPKAMHKDKVMTKSALKGKAKAKSTAAEDGSEDEFRAPGARRKIGDTTGPSSPKKRRSKRT